MLEPVAAPPLPPEENADALTRGVIDKDLNLLFPVNPTILVIHASVGSGHRTAADAVAKALEMLRDDPTLADLYGVKPDPDLEVHVLDILEWGRIKFNGDNTASMFTGATRPIYDLTWRYILTGRLLWGGGEMWSLAMFPKFVQYVRHIKPLAIVCTHITAANAAVGARMQANQHFPVICVPTDYEVEGWWPHLHSDMICVANEFMAETLRPRKVPESHIRITGIPTRPGFGKTYARKEVRNAYGLPNDKRVALVLAGAHLPRPYIHFRQSISELMPYIHTFHNLHLVIICGQDPGYADYVRKGVKDFELENVTVLEYVNDLAPLMSACDFTICKAGGLTVTECLDAHIPMILLGRAYGQEKANVRMLTGSGAALSASTTRELVEALHYIDNHPEIITAMKVSASFLARPNAALDVAQATYQLIERGPELDSVTQGKKIAHFYWGNRPAHER
ncbi:MAG: UDP-N-acetylglucosamine--LPS N-acetylglucosamine transferase [Eggerthellaceae bacterium]|nr:UDP-N-acetylglucosamine--LPS N-acetylglucosamine transferase [Eggerthellaceae bacterium]